MRILRTSLTFLLIASMISCSLNHPADLVKQNLHGIKTSELFFNFGDVVSIKDSNNYYAAILFDVDSDSAGIWYGFCLTNFKDSTKPDIRSLDTLFLFGRQIPSGIINSQCIDCYDLTYINEKCLLKNKNKISLIVHIDYNPLKIYMGSDSPTRELSGLIKDYNWGIERRSMTPDDCKKSIFKLNAVRERYFPLSMIK
jgi:hypothetical protein